MGHFTLLHLPWVLTKNIKLLCKYNKKGKENVGLLHTSACSVARSILENAGKHVNGVLDKVNGKTAVNATAF